MATQNYHPDTPAWFIPYLLENERQHAELGRRITESHAALAQEIARVEARLLWRGLTGIAAITGAAVAVVKLL